MRVEPHLDIIHEKNASTVRALVKNLLRHKSCGGEKKKRFNQAHFKLNYLALTSRGFISLLKCQQFEFLN